MEERLDSRKVVVYRMRAQAFIDTLRSVILYIQCHDFAGPARRVDVSGEGTEPVLLIVEMLGADFPAVQAGFLLLKV